MTDFGQRPGTLFATQAKQDLVLTALGTLHTDLEAFVARTPHTFVPNITFDDDPTSYTSLSIDVSAYRRFELLITLAVVLAPTDIVIRVQFSDDDTIFYNYMNGPFGDIRYEDTAGTKTEAISGECVAKYMRVFVQATGTSAANKFLLTVKAILAG